MGVQNVNIAVRLRGVNGEVTARLKSLKDATDNLSKPNLKGGTFLKVRVHLRVQNANKKHKPFKLGRYGQALESSSTYHTIVLRLEGGY